MTRSVSLSSKPARRLDVTCAPVDGEIVLYDPLSGEMFRLDHRAAIIWNTLDGDVTIEELSRQVAAVVDIDRGHAAADLLKFTRALAEAGLLRPPF